MPTKKEPTMMEFLLDPRGELKHCAFCRYFEPYSGERILPDTGYGDCTVPAEAVNVPDSYRAYNDGTHACYGSDCAFFERSRTELPEWPFLEMSSKLVYDDEEAPTS